MHRSVIESLQAPKAIGPYSQAIAVPASRMVFLSGQIPLDPATGELVPGDVSVQTAQVMKNLGAVLSAAGVSFDHVVRCTIYLVDLGDFARGQQGLRPGLPHRAAGPGDGPGRRAPQGRPGGDRRDRGRLSRPPVEH